MVDPVRPLVLIALIEAVAAVLVLVGVVVAVVTGATEGMTGGGTGLAAAEVAMWLLVVVAMALIWLGLYRRRALARTPFLLAQAFGLVLVPLFVGSDLLGWRVAGWLLAVLGVAGIVLGLRPSVRSSLV
jgi:hypothetical protein